MSEPPQSNSWESTGEGPFTERIFCSKALGLSRESVDAMDLIGLSLCCGKHVFGIVHQTLLIDIAQTVHRT